MGLFPSFLATMKVFVRAQDSQVLDVCGSATVAQVKEQLSVEECQLSFGGRMLADDQTLSSYGIESLNTLDLTVALKGGKQHGSLTQAGRVKGRTPKVPKMEGKKKPKTGRCKRRLQYNRRFVNTVVSFGGKAKGPNSNSA